MPWLGNALGAFGARAVHVPNPPYNPPVETTVFNVTTYGASNTASNNATTGIQAAYNAARANSAGGAHSTVYFPAGTYAVGSNVLLNTIRTNDWYGQSSPTVQQAGIVAFSGYNANIRLTGNTGFLRAAYGGVWTAPAEATYGNLVIEGFTVDNNNRASSSGALVLTMNGYGNVDNVIVRDVVTPNNMAYRTAQSTPANIDGLMINMNPVNRSQAHACYVTDVSIIDCTIYGKGKGIGIYSNNDGMTTFGLNPCIYDNILIDGCYVNTNNFYGSNIHLGSNASGYSCIVRNTTCEDSSDDGLEIDAFNEVLVENCSFSKCRQPICFVWFSYPWSTSTPNYTVRGCDYSGDCSSYWPDTQTLDSPIRAPMMPELRAGQVSGQGSYADVWGRSWGNYTIEGCTLTLANDYTSYNSSFTIGSNGPPMTSVTITDCDITDAGPSGDPIYIRQGTALGITLDVTINDVRYRTSTGAAYALLTASQVTLVGARSVDSDISGLT